LLQYDDLLKHDRIWQKWINIIREALICLKSERKGDRLAASWEFLPGAGGYYDQDQYIFSIWEWVRFCYLDLSLNDEDITGAKSKN
jgi:hypothetical protein